MSTLKRRLVSIGVIHKLKGHYLDTKHPSIIENIMGIKRRKGSIQKAKKPILINSLKLIIDAIDKQNKQEIKKFRDRSIILIGFSGGFRRNEIVSLDYDDLDFVHDTPISSRTLQDLFLIHPQCELHFFERPNSFLL